MAPSLKSIIRTLDEQFIDDLKPGGILAPIIEAVKNDKTLFFCIRKNYFNIYYQGGSLMRVDKKGKHGYPIEFNINYTETEDECNNLLKMLQPGEFTYDNKGKRQYYMTIAKTAADALKWVYSIPRIKNIMDIYFSKDEGKEMAERFYQQMMCRENTRSKISKDMDYYITDIEHSLNFPKPKIGAKGKEKKFAKIDMIAIKWPGDTKENDNHEVSLAFIEMKYGDKAMAGVAGIKEHLADMVDLGEEYEAARQSTEKQLEILNELGLLAHTNKKCKFTVINIKEEKPEYILLFANSGRGLNKDILEECKKFNTPEMPFKLKFFVANFAGYGLYKKCVMDYEDFEKRIQALGTAV
jgi:hypothetical protein